MARQGGFRTVSELCGGGGGDLGARMNPCIHTREGWARRNRAQGMSYAVSIPWQGLQHLAGSLSLWAVGNRRGRPLVMHWNGWIQDWSALDSAQQHTLGISTIL